MAHPVIFSSRSEPPFHCFLLFGLLSAIEQPTRAGAAFIGFRAFFNGEHLTGGGTTDREWRGEIRTVYDPSQLSQRPKRVYFLARDC